MKKIILTILFLSTFSFANAETLIYIKNIDSTNATTTNAFATNASSTNLYGANLSTCDAVSGKLTWANGLFGCGSDTSGGASTPNLIQYLIGGTKFYSASTTDTTNLSWLFKNGFVSQASSTITSLTISGLTSSGLAVNNLGNVYASATTTFNSPLTYSNGAVSCATCLTANQTITLSGIVTGSGATAITTAFGTIAANSLYVNATNGVAAPTVMATSSLFKDASATVTGLLNSTDWSTFNNKQPAGAYLTTVDISANTNLTGGAGLTITGDDMACDTASGSVFGCLSSANWTTFNGKEDVLTFNSPLSRSVNTISCPTCGGASSPNLIQNTIGATKFYTASTTDTTNLSWQFKNGFVSQASSTVSSLVITGNSTTTNATTTNIVATTKASTTALVVSNLNAASCDVKSSTSGVLSCGTDATGSGATTITSSATVSDAVIATFTAITGLSFTAAASTNYLIDCFLIASSSVSTTGMSFAWDTPASPTRILMTGYMPISASVPGSFLQRADNVAVGITTGVNVAFLEQPVILQARLQNVNSGTMQLGFTPETANRVDIVQGSVCQYRTY